MSARTNGTRALATTGILATALIAAALAGCTPDTPQQTAPLTGSASSSSASGTGGSGGSGGSASTTSSTAAAGDGGASSSSSSAGSQASTGTGTGGSAPAWPCTQDQGYWATSTGFMSPTPEPLAAALNELAYDAGAHPISFVNHAAPGVLEVAISGTTTGSNGDVFPAPAPTFQTILPTDGEGVTTVNPQPRAFLHFVDMAGPVEIEIDHLVWSASETFNCNDVWVDVEAVLPSSTYATVLHLADGDMTVGDLVNQQMTPAPQVHLSFHGQTMSFDFSSL